MGAICCRTEIATGRDRMSELSESPEMMMELLAKLVHKNGGYIRLTGTDEPIGPFSLLSRVDTETGVVELRLEDKQEVGTA